MLSRPIDTLATTKDNTFLKSVGITFDEGTSSSENSEDEDNIECQQFEIMDNSEFAALTEDCEYNWFCIDERLVAKQSILMCKG